MNYVYGDDNGRANSLCGGGEKIFGLMSGVLSPPPLVILLFYIFGPKNWKNEGN